MDDDSCACTSVVDATGLVEIWSKCAACMAKGPELPALGMQLTRLNECGNVMEGEPVDDVAAWFDTYRENLAGYLDVPVMPKGLSPQEAAAWADEYTDMLTAQLVNELLKENDG